MSFYFLGTFSLSQYERFRAYVRAQVQAIDARLQHLEAEIVRLGSLEFAYDQSGLPLVYTGDPPTTYCGKLFAAYEALGGDVEYDLQVRSKTQSVYLLKSSYTRPPQMLSNGEILSMKGLSDAQSAVLVQRVKKFVSEDLKRRRTYLERKILRAIDYSEQLKTEISELTALKLTAENAGSLEGYLKTIEALAGDPNYLAITDDSSDPDPHGKFSRAPMAAYTPGPDGATSESFQRTQNGFFKPDK